MRPSVEVSTSTLENETSAVSSRRHGAAVPCSSELYTKVATSLTSYIAVSTAERLSSSIFLHAASRHSAGAVHGNPLEPPAADAKGIAPAMSNRFMTSNDKGDEVLFKKSILFGMVYQDACVEIDFMLFRFMGRERSLVRIAAILVLGAIGLILTTNAFDASTASWVGPFLALLAGLSFLYAVITTIAFKLFRKAFFVSRRETSIDGRSVESHRAVDDDDDDDAWLNEADVPFSTVAKFCRMHELFQLLFGLLVCMCSVYWYQWAASCTRERKYSQVQFNTCVNVIPPPAIAVQAGLSLLFYFRQFLSIFCSLITVVILFLPRAELSGIDSSGTVAIDVVIHIMWTVLSIAIVVHRDLQARKLFEEHVRVKSHARVALRLRQQLDAALERLLPDSVWERMQSGVAVSDVATDAVVVVFEISDFIRWSTTMLPTDVVDVILFLYGTFDQLCEASRTVARAKAVGDRYIATAGLVPVPTTLFQNRPVELRNTASTGVLKHDAISLQLRHCSSEVDTCPRYYFDAVRLAYLALHELKAMNVKMKRGGVEEITAVVAVHCGPLGGAVIGQQSLSYEVVGPALEMTLQFLASCKPSVVTVSSTIADLVTKFQSDTLEHIRTQEHTSIPHEVQLFEFVHEGSAELSSLAEHPHAAAFAGLGSTSSATLFPSEALCGSPGETQSTATIGLCSMRLNSSTYALRSPPIDLPGNNNSSSKNHLMMITSTPEVNTMREEPQEDSRTALVLVENRRLGTSPALSARKINDMLPCDNNGSDATGSTTQQGHVAVSQQSLRYRIVRQLIHESTFRSLKSHVDKKGRQHLPTTNASSARDSVTLSSSQGEHITSSAQTNNGKSLSTDPSTPHTQQCVVVPQGSTSMFEQNPALDSSGRGTVASTHTSETGPDNHDSEKYFGREGFEVFRLLMLRKPTASFWTSPMRWRESFQFRSPIAEREFSIYFVAAYHSFGQLAFLFHSVVYATLTVLIVVDITSVRKTQSDYTLATEPLLSVSSVFSSPCVYLSIIGVILPFVGALCNSNVLGVGGSRTDLILTESWEVCVSSLLSPTRELNDETANVPRATLHAAATNRHVIQVVLLTACSIFSFFVICSFPLSTVNADVQYLFLFNSVMTYMVCLLPSMTFAVLACHTVAMFVGHYLTYRDNAVRTTIFVVFVVGYAASLVGVFIREGFERAHFESLCFSVALRQAAVEELQLYRALVRMTIPSTLLPIALNQAACQGMENTMQPFAQFIADICTLEVRLDNFSDMMMRNPAAAVDVAERGLRFIDALMLECVQCFAVEIAHLPVVGDHSQRTPKQELDEVSSSYSLSSLTGGSVQTTSHHREEDEARKMAELVITRLATTGDRILFVGPLLVNSTERPMDKKQEQMFLKLTLKVILRFMTLARQKQIYSRPFTLLESVPIPPHPSLSGGEVAFHAGGSSPLPSSPRPLSLSQVACCGSAFLALIGTKAPSFNLLGFVARQSTSLLRAAPFGFCGVTESFHRLVADANDSATMKYFGAPVRWRVRGMGTATLVPVTTV